MRWQQSDTARKCDTLRRQIMSEMNNRGRRRMSSSTGKSLTQSRATRLLATKETHERKHRIEYSWQNSEGGKQKNKAMTLFFMTSGRREEEFLSRELDWKCACWAYEAVAAAGQPPPREKSVSFDSKRAVNETNT